MELTGTDTFFWKTEAKSAFIRFQIRDSMFNVKEEYLIKDDGQFILPVSLIQEFATKRLNLYFLRSY
mgnify:CR=1 FL=1